LKDRTSRADAGCMATPDDTTLNASNTAAFDLAIEMLTIALRHERDPDEGRAELLRARLSGGPGTDALRDRVSINRRLLATFE
jgi:hypothetical protein